MAVTDLKEDVQVAVIEAAKEIAINEVKYGNSQGKKIAEVFEDAVAVIQKSINQ